MRGGDSFTELGGVTQTCEFEQGLYINPGPWRIPYHHRALLDYCKRLNVALEPFIQLNHNALLHATKAFGGAPQRIRDIKADFQGQVSELLAKATQQGKLDEAVTKEDREILMQALRSWGALDRNYAYKANLISAEFPRLCQRSRRRPWRGAGPGRADRAVGHPEIAALALFAEFRAPSIPDHDVSAGRRHGHDRQGVRQGSRRRHPLRCESDAIQQDDRGVTVTYTDLKAPATPQQAKADWCVCTIPLPILSQLPVDVGARMKAAIDAVPYSASVKIGLQFKRRFWEEDEAIYGGISYTDLPIRQIAYPNTGFNRAGKGVLLGAYLFDGPNAYEFTAMPPAERVARAVEFGASIHPQYAAEFENGVAVAWHRMPFTLGCAGDWTDRARAEHYDNLCQIDGRIVLAGEHASYIPAWQEGAILSSLDAITRLHERVVKT